MGTVASCHGSDSINGSSNTLQNNIYTPRDNNSTPIQKVSIKTFESSYNDADFLTNKHIRQINELEDEVAKLKTKIAEYEEEIKLIHDLRTREELPTFDETLKIKEMQIRKVNDELEKIKVENTKIKARCKKKIKEYALKLSEEKQSSSIRVMELRQEAHKLNSENLQLKERLGLTDIAITPRKQSSSSDEANNKLVVVLSSQLQEQREKNSQLEKQLKERELYISQLESKTEKNDGKTKKRRPLRTQVEEKNSTRLLSGMSRDSGLDSDGHPDSATIRRPMLSHLGTVSESESLGTLLPLEYSFVSEISEDFNADAESMDSFDTLLDGKFLRRRQNQSIIFDPDTQKTIENLIDN